MGRILVIDDSPIMRNLLLDFLSDLGHQTTSAGNREEAIMAIRQRPFDLCICDLHLPGIIGRDLQQTLDQIRPGLHYIFTDSMPDQISEEIIAEGRYPYLRKPFELSHFRLLIERQLIMTGQM